MSPLFQCFLVFNRIFINSFQENIGQKLVKLLKNIKITSSMSTKLFSLAPSIIGYKIIHTNL